MTQEELLQVIQQAKRKNATTLNLRGKGLTELPPEIGQLTTLITLDLSRNKLQILPSEIGQLINLKTLNIKRNALITIPSEIGQLTQLKGLYLENNALTNIPPEIGQLTALTHLYIEYNYLTFIPSQIGELINLIVLDLSNNHLATIPFELSQLIKLQKLELRSNSLPIPSEILYCWNNPSIILTYIRESIVARPLHEAKLLVVGQGGVGKTSLIRRLTQGDYNPQENMTEGIAINHWPLEINGDPIQLNIWDFGGQEIMHATHQFFLTKRSLYLLVLDSRLNENDNRLEYWLQIIASFGGDSPIILVGNKGDQKPLDIDKRGLMHKYPAIKAILETSCATGAGIEALQAAIRETLATLPHIHDQLPATWFALKKKLEGLGRDYLPYDEYTQFCAEGQIGEPIAQTTLLGFLHDLGVVLHFRDDPRLEEMSILNPLWVTQAVYKILNHRPLLANNGLLTLHDLQTILQDPAYPRAKQIYILDMLRKFELCYDLEGQRDTVLLPDLLPKEQPDLGQINGLHKEEGGSRTAPTLNTLAFQYHYNVLPGSILTRFIVRLHPYIAQGVVWRSGVLLAYQESQALVRADYEARKIFMTITSPHHDPAKNGRTFLAIIRSHFEAIHASLPGLAVQEKISLSGHPHVLEDYAYLLKLEKMGETHFVPRDLEQRVALSAFLEGIVSTAPEKRGSGGKEQRRDLLQTLTTAFNKQGIRELCFDLNLEYEDLAGDTLKGEAMSLIETMERNGRLTELLILVQEHRPRLR